MFRGIKILFLGFLVLALSGCEYQLQLNNKPSDLIPKDTFTYVLHDMMVVEAYYSSQPINVQNFYSKIPSVMDTVFRKYNIDTARFNRSFDYYANQQEEMIKIYQSIQDSLTLHSVELEQADTVIMK